MNEKRLDPIRVMIIGSALGIVLAGFVATTVGSDQIHHLANVIGLPNGHVIAALLGGLLGLWLSLGGSRRIAAFSGWLIGVFAAWLLWQAGAGYVWVIETVLVAAFGSEAVAFTSLAAFLLLFGVVRWAAGVGARAVTALLAWGVKWEARRVLAKAVAVGD